MSTHARSFRWAGALLSPHQLDRAAVIYAFCRLVDDLADEAPDPDTARTDLARVRAQIQDGGPTDPLVTAARDVLEDGGAGIGPALHLLDGVTSDLDPVLVPDDAGLHRYAYQVAGTVGLMMCAVLGVQQTTALPFAVDLGVGMQITNICRDVLEDAVRGRVYLPATRLRQRGLEPERLIQAAQNGPDLTGEERASLSAVVTDLINEADRYYASADQGMRWIPWRSRLAIRVASRVYRAIGVKLRSNGGDAWAGRTRVGMWGKVRWTLAALVLTIRSMVRGHPTHQTELHRNLRDLPGCQA
ncbi:MAG: phytoene/squalene synthase family protein [Myxococcota bacterium]